MKRFFLPFVFIGILSMGLYAQESEATEPASGDEQQPAKHTPKYEFSGSGNFMFGQVVSGHAFGKGNENLIDHQWQDFYGGNIFATSYPTEWLTTKIGLEVRSSFPITAVTSIMRETYRVQYRSFLPRAEGILHWDFGNQSSLFIESGIFPYNFNPEIKNFGNYLYRGIAYPLYLETKLDYPWYDMLGMRTEYAFLDNQVKVGAIVNSAITHAPFYDFSMAFTASYTTPEKVFEVAAGIDFDRVFSVNSYVTDSKANYSKSGYDSVNWTLRSTKLDTRATFDIKPLFGNPGIMGKLDAKLYAEVAILGFKDPDYFHDTTFTPSLFHRMPILFGVNFPCFKVLDVFSLELEYFNSPYSNDWWGNYSQPSPVPVHDPATPLSVVENYKTKDNLKWSVYVKKSFSKFDIIGIFANDHTIYDTYSAEAQINTEQSLRTEKDWHWYLKLQYNL
jgi:hypothetical protein